MESSRPTSSKKLVLLGDSGVGKTCIISRFISGDFEKELNSTDGASYSVKEVKIPKLNKTIILDIWDTAGQEKYRTLTKYFYKDATMIIMVYDITRKDSFESLKNYWYKEIQVLGEKNCILAIAGNKSDLYDREQVPEEDARNYAKSINAVYGLTSAQNNSGIDKLFEDIAIKFLDPDFQEKIEEDNRDKKRKTSIQLNKNEIKKYNKEGNKKKKFC